MATAKPPLAQHWAAIRDAPSERDKTLSSVAHSRFEALAVPLRPNHLCRLYPRVANLIALCWPDPALTKNLFDALLVDKRGGRKGFPPEVAAELVRLREQSAALLRSLETAALAAAEDDKWAPHLLSPSDR